LSSGNPFRNLRKNHAAERAIVQADILRSLRKHSAFLK